MLLSENTRSPVRTIAVAAVVAGLAWAPALRADAPGSFRLDLKTPSVAGRGFIALSFPLSVGFNPQSETASLKSVVRYQPPAGAPEILPTGLAHVDLVLAHGPGESKLIVCGVQGFGLARMDVRGLTGAPGPWGVTQVPVANGAISMTLGPVAQSGNRTIELYGVQAGKAIAWQFTGCTITPQAIAAGTPSTE